MTEDRGFESLGSACDMMRTKFVYASRCIREEYPPRTLSSLFNAFGGINTLLHDGRRVLVKPNVNFPTRESGVNTNPAIIESLIQLLMDSGVDEVAIGEGSGIESDTSRIFKATGYDEIAEKTGARLIDFDSSEKVKLEVPNGLALKDLEIPKPLLDYDVLINVPLAKTSICTTVTLCLKNLMGILSKRYKVKAHLSGLSQAIVDIHKAVKPELNILDATVGMEGFGPISGTPKRTNWILMSRSAVELDSVAAKLMGIEPSDIEHLKRASEQGLGTIEASEIDLSGIDLEKDSVRFTVPNSTPSVAEGVRLSLGETCRNCIGPYNVAIFRIDKNGKLPDLKGLEILMGKRAKPSGKVTRTLAIGNCCKPIRDKVDCYVPGCPPPGILIGDSIKVLCGIEKEPTRYMRRWYELMKQIAS